MNGRRKRWGTVGFKEVRDMGPRGGGKRERGGNRLGLKEERKSIAFISYIVNLVLGSNDS